MPHCFEARIGETWILPLIETLLPPEFEPQVVIGSMGQTRLIGSLLTEALWQTKAGSSPSFFLFGHFGSRVGDVMLAVKGKATVAVRPIIQSARWECNVSNPDYSNRENIRVLTQ
jgi:hypothetical protein